MSLLTAAALGASAVGSLVGAGTSIANFGLQAQNYKYMKSMQEKAWNREDNSVQRRVADMKAAGLNPVLAAGQGASSSAPVKLETPQIGDVGKDIGSLANVLSVIQQKNSISMQDQELQILRHQRETTNAQMHSAMVKKDMDMAMGRYANQFADQSLAQQKLATQQMAIDTLQKQENYRILKDMGYTGKFIGILKDILGPVSPLLYGKRR